MINIISGDLSLHPYFFLFLAVDKTLSFLNVNFSENVATAH